MYKLYDSEVIYDVTLVTGKTYRGQFNHEASKRLDGLVSLDLYVPDETKPEAWIDLNPTHIVSVQVWLT